jgi:TRAP-type C4-dicarboxylate transport system substrate-binding protein
VSKTWFDTLPPSIQNDIRKAARQTIQIQRKLWKDAVQEATIRLEEAGMAFETIDRELFYTAVQPVYLQMFEELGPEFEDVVRAIRAVK